MDHWITGAIAVIALVRYSTLLWRRRSMDTLALVVVWSTILAVAVMTTALLLKGE